MKSFSFFFLLSLTSGALAQSAPPTKPTTTDLPEVVITAKKDSPSLTVPSLEARQEQMAKTIPGGAGVVDAEIYKRGRTSTLRDALDFAPGVFIQSRFGAEESRLSIRGSGIQRTYGGRGVWLMLDGVPLNQADGGMEMQSVEPLATNYIEVYRGANALQYGAATLGGAVNFISHTGHTAPAAQARFEMGSFNTQRGQISSGFVSGNTDVYASITASHSDGFRDWSKSDSLRIFANIGTKLSANLENRFFITYVDSNWQLPEAITKAQMQNNPQQANAAALAGRYSREFHQVRLADKLTYSDGDNTLALSLFWTWKDVNHPNFLIIDNLTNDLGFDLRYDHKGRLFGMENSITVGTNFMYGVADDNRFINISGERGAKVADNKLQSMNLGFYLQDQLHLTDKLSLIAGSSVMYATRDFKEQTLFGLDNSDRQEFWGFNPKLGLLYEVDPKTQIYFNASRSFEPPTFAELTTVNGTTPSLVPLKPQTATTLELGTRGQSRRLSWDFSYYYAWLDDEMLTLGVPGNATLTTNAGRTIHQGVELFVNADLWRNLTTSSTDSYDRVMLRQKFLWNDFHFERDAAYGDRRMPGIPPFYYRADLLYEHPCGFYIGPNVEWAPQSYAVDLARTTFADPYALLGLKVGYRTKKGFSVFIEARNLTDKNYAATTGVVQNASLPAQAAAFLPGDGRAFYGGIEWKW